MGKRTNSQMNGTKPPKITRDANGYYTMGDPTTVDMEIVILPEEPNVLDNVGEFIDGVGENIANGVTESMNPVRQDASPLPYIPTGRRFDLNYEPQTGLPVDGGDPLYRLYSPFVLQYLPPADAQAYLGDMSVKANRSNVPNVAILSQALQGAYGVTNAYDNGISQQSYNSMEALAQQQAYRNLSMGEGAESSFVGSAQTLSYLSQLFALINLPPLQFLINPNSMQLTYTKIQDFSSRTRKNRVFKAWGEDQPKISFSAMTGGFIAQASQGNASLDNFFTLMDTPAPNSPSGLQYASKRHSLAFQHFMEILQMYQNACLIYDKIFDTEAHLGVGSFMVHYDQMTYEGLIESFDYSYNEETPNSLQFNFDFTVSKMYDWNSQQGAPQRIQAPNVKNRRRR